MKRYAWTVGVLVLLLLLVLVYGYRPRSTVTSAAGYQRIVSIVPSTTELLFAVGAGDQVVGDTTYCVYPPEARTKEKIGDLIVNTERVLSLRPDVIMSAPLTRKSNEDLEKLGFNVVVVEANSFDEIAGELRRLGRLTGHPETGDTVAEALVSRVRAVDASIRGKAQPTVFIETNADPIWTAGPRSYLDDLIRHAGGQNVMDDLDRPWASVSWEVVLARDPDIILLVHDATSMESRAGWSGLHAVRSGHVHHVPKESFLYPTPRLADGLELAARLFHEPR